MKFRKKPLVIEAQQWTTEYMPDGIHVATSQCPRTAEVRSYPHVHTMHGPVAVKLGDWITPDLMSLTYYPIDAGVMEATYNQVGEESLVNSPFLPNHPPEPSLPNQTKTRSA